MTIAHKGILICVGLLLWLAVGLLLPRIQRRVEHDLPLPAVLVEVQEELPAGCESHDLPATAVGGGDDPIPEVSQRVSVRAAGGLCRRFSGRRGSRAPPSRYC
jgi:hypothetical protein